MWYRVAAGLMVVVHLLFISFVVGGVFLAWRWPRIAWAHLPAVVYGALAEFVGFPCPLTPLENDLRHHAGEAGYRGGSIAHYLVRVIHPAGLTRAMQAGLGVLVLPWSRPAGTGDSSAGMPAAGRGEGIGRRAPGSA